MPPFLYLVNMLHFLYRMTLMLHTRENSAMNDKDRLEAELQGIESALDDLEIEHNKGMIDIGRYLKLKTEYETRKAELERELGGAQDTAAALSTADPPDTARLFICYKHHADPDQELAVYLHNILSNQGHEVFIDLDMRAGDVWPEKIDEHIKASDFLVVLLSHESAHSEMVRAEVNRAYEYRKLYGKPFTLPVRVAYEGLLPYSIAAFLGTLQYVVWQGEEDSEQLAQEILAAIAGRLPQAAPAQAIAVTPKPVISEDGQLVADDGTPHPPSPEFDPRLLKELAVPGGVVRLRDKFYVEREADAQLKAQVVKWGSTTTIRAPRQTGKTSLLMRGIHYAREQGINAAFLDFQSLGSDQWTSLDVFLRQLAETICDELGMDEETVEQAWRGKRSTTQKLLRFMEKYVLPAFDEPIVLAMDEADHLFQANFYKDFFALLRSWHNRRALRQVWQKFNMVLVISTEPYLLIDDVYQSPFNVGLDLDLADLDATQVRDLNQRHDSPLAGSDLPHLMTLLHGHPFLTRRALYVMATQRMTWAELVRDAPSDHGPFGDHLRRQHWVIRDKTKLKEALKEIIKTGRCSDEESLFRLLRAGLVQGSGDVCACRCDLYKLYFKDRLL
jgi:hypothetical protein